MVALARETEFKRIGPQPGPQTAFLSCDADIAIYGGAAGGGKSFAMLLDPLRHCGIAGFDGVIFRRTTPEITNPGALWDESEQLYPSAGASPRIGALEWEWPSGATVAFRHMEHEKDKTRYQGPSFAFIGFDELTHFTETQFWYLVSRNRSTCGVAPYIRGTCNPDSDSWVAKFVAWWIDPETGFAIPERSGVKRYVQRRDGELHWHDDAEASREAAREAGVADEDNLPRSVTFIAASLEDNPALTKVDPSYRANLLSLPSVEQQRLLRGNWKVSHVDGAEWPAEYFVGDIWFDDWPAAEDVLWKVISLDPSLGKTAKSDYTAYVLSALGKDGFVYVDADLARRDLRRTARAGIEHCRWFQPHTWAIETNGFLALQELIEEIAGNDLLPPIASVTQHASKHDRIRLGLTTLLEKQRIRFHRGSSGVAMLLSQLRQFPVGDHDDGPDSLDTNIRVLRQLSADGVQGEPLPEHADA